MGHAPSTLPISPFSIPDERPFLSSLNSAILGALDVQSIVADLKKLNHHERLFICVDTFLTEAEAGGVSHFFYYDCADLYDQVLLGLEEIGARSTRGRLELYVNRVFGGEIPKSVTARQYALEAPIAEEEEEAGRVVSDLSEVVSQLASWARAHREQFRLR